MAPAIAHGQPDSWRHRAASHCRLAHRRECQRASRDRTPVSSHATPSPISTAPAGCAPVCHRNARPMPAASTIPCAGKGTESAPLASICLIAAVRTPTARPAMWDARESDWIPEAAHLSPSPLRYAVCATVFCVRSPSPGAVRLRRAHRTARIRYAPPLISPLSWASPSCRSSLTCIGSRHNNRLWLPFPARHAERHYPLSETAARTA